MHPNNSQPLPVPSCDEILEILVRRIDQQKQAVGIAVGVIEPKSRRVVGYGKLASDNPGTLDGDTIFEIGSITKVFTSLVLADMVKRKEVAFDDPAAKYLSGNIKMPERSGKAITLLDLSMHTSGLPRLPSNLSLQNAANPYAGYGVDDLYQFLSSYTLPRDPGSEVEYSNLGAGLLGHVLACCAGMDYESLIRTLVTGPLGMVDTGIALFASRKQRMATGHNAMLAAVVNWDLPTLAGAGALRSSANDMLTFLEAFLGYRETPLAPAMKAMHEVRRPLGATGAEIGLAWHMIGESAWHNGGTGGFRSFVGYDPKRRTGVVVLSNASTASGVDDLAGHIWNPRVPLSNFEAPKQRIEIQIDPTLLDNYVGRYQLAPNVVLEISRDGSRLFAQTFLQATCGAKFELFAEAEKKFFAKVADNQISFETGSDGLATGLVLCRGGRDMPRAGIRALPGGSLEAGQKA